MDSLLLRLYGNREKKAPSYETDVELVQVVTQSHCMNPWMILSVFSHPTLVKKSVCKQAVVTLGGSLAVLPRSST